MCLHALVAALVLSGAMVEDSFPLELMPSNVGGGKVTSREPPSDCQPPLFDPSRPGDPGFEAPEVRRVPLVPPFSLTVYGFACASTFSAVLEVTKGGARHALYTHVEEDWQLSADKRTLVMKNVVAGPGGTWERKFRSIDIASKKAVALPSQLACSAYVMGRRGAKYVSTSGVDYQGPPPEACVWGEEGLLARFRVDGLEFSGGANDSPANSLELLPAEPTGAYVLTTDSGEGEQFNCVFAAMDWKDPSRRYRRVLPVKLDGMSCNRAADRVELDVSKFTFDQPTLRYRVVPGRGSSGVASPRSWETVR